VKSIQDISDHLISKSILGMNSTVEMERSNSMKSISVLTQTNFSDVDKEFQKFGRNYKEFIMKGYNFERELILDSFSKLVLNNIGFSNFSIVP
jgi:hypothetical protein